jgi:hypothetical protein
MRFMLIQFFIIGFLALFTVPVAAENNQQNLSSNASLPLSPDMSVKGIINPYLTPPKVPDWYQKAWLRLGTVALGPLGPEIARQAGAEFWLIGLPVEIWDSYGVLKQAVDDAAAFETLKRA